MGQRAVEAVARRFGAGGARLKANRDGRGHIHETWFVSDDDGAQFVVQCLNDRVFPDPVHVMDNLLRVTSHLQRRAGPDGGGRRVLSVVRTDDGAALVYDEQGRPWRAFRRVEGARTPELVATPEVAREVGRGLGRFLAQVQRLPGPRLAEPIPGFKDFARRRQDFELVVETDPYDRVSTCRAEIDAVRRHHSVVEELAEAWASGRLRERIVHNDAKADNVLLDEATGEAVCVIDLDTVAPGTVLYDVGDLLRSATVTSREDVTDLASLAVRDDLLEEALSGYLSEAGDELSGGELELLPLAGPLMAYETALRFLTDHLAGDVYFRIDRPRHNLERARAQLRVLEALSSARSRVAQLVHQATA